MTVYTFDAPAHYACPLINGDLSGLDYYGDECVAEYEAWAAAHPEECRDVTGTESDEPWIGRFNGLQTEMLTYTALRREE